MGLPLSRVSSSANSSICFSIRSASLQIRRLRSLADIFRHGPLRSSKTLRAAETARSTSATSACEICVNTSPVAGLMVSKRLAVSAHSLLMSSRPGVILHLVGVSIGIKKGRHACPGRADLFRLKFCRALFNVGSQSFFRVFALEQQLLIFALHRKRRLHRNFP